jgi:hypothetical protein
MRFNELKRERERERERDITGRSGTEGFEANRG